jgi:hypothetical protein
VRQPSSNWQLLLLLLPVLLLLTAAKGDLRRPVSNLLHLFTSRVALRRAHARRFDYYDEEVDISMSPLRPSGRAPAQDSTPYAAITAEMLAIGESRDAADDILRGLGQDALQDRPMLERVPNRAPSRRARGRGRPERSASGHA